MTREEAIERLNGLAESRDNEKAHSQADDLLCDLLRTLGYGDVVEAYSKIDKWYA
jgi:hypothetical protein